MKTRARPWARHGYGFDVAAGDGRWPLADRLSVDADGIAYFDKGRRASHGDRALLAALPSIETWYGAASTKIYPFSGPVLARATGASVLQALGARHFRNRHIRPKDLKRATLAAPAPTYDESDAVFTSEDETFVFATEDDVAALANAVATGEESAEVLRQAQASRGYHLSLRALVENHRLFSVRLHCGRLPAQEFTEWVLLFVVGASIHSGRLVGAVTYQACHNFCD